MIYGRYNEMLLISDSCEAVTIFKDLYVPNIFAIGSSSLDEKSYSDRENNELGISTNDKFLFFIYLLDWTRFSYLNYEFMKTDFPLNSNLDLSYLLSKYDPTFLKSHVGTENTLNRKPS